MSTKKGAALSTEIVPEVLIKNKNYEEWSIRLRTYLKAQDVWDVIESTWNEAVDDKVWQKKNATALHAIHISCGPDAFSDIKHIPEAKGAWDKLAKPEPELETEETILSRNDGKEQYKELYKAVREGDLDKTVQFITENPIAVTAKVTCTERTALHVAAMAGRQRIVKMLVEKMQNEDLVQLTDEDGFTALVAAITCNAKPSIAKYMVEKNNELVTTMAYDMLPAALAFRYGHKEMGRYLYTITPPDYLLQHRQESATIICNAIYAQSCDVALDLLSKCKELAVTRDMDGVRPVYALANHPSAFKCGCRLKFWQECLYRCICINSSFAIKSGNDLPHKVWPKLRGKTLYLLKILGIQDVYDMKKVHIQTSELVRCMCNVIRNLNLDQMEELRVNEALFQAVERGNVEFVRSILNANLELVEILDKSYMNIFMLATKFRHPKIFSLIYDSNSKLSATSAALNKEGNTMLHLAAYLPPNPKLNEIPGAALQMQRELQWFHEVKSIAPPWALDYKNNQGMTPSGIFTQEHKELVKEGEKWMKDTANSCTVVGALIITVMFAAAFTVPGGNEDSGLPIFLTNKWFLTFIISDSISLFTSTTSVLMFLGILTSRYAEDDFLQSLPRKLMIGLFTLFASIASMMVAFSATLFIVLKDRYSWIFVPVICFAVIPVTLFVFMQSRLLVDILRYTYGKGIFDKKARI